MPVPTVTTITPDAGPSMGGNMVEIVGTNFRLPDPPPATGPVPTPLTTETVLVEFGGAPAAKTFVVSATRIFVPVPKYPLYDAVGRPLPSALVDVTVTNLANDGAPIPGEVVTVADAFTYARPDISAQNQSDYTRLVRQLLRMLKSEVIPNVTHEISTEYDENLATPQREQGSLPGISVLGPEVRENTFRRNTTESADTALSGGGGFLMKRRPHIVDLEFDIIGYSDNDVEFLNLLSLAQDWKDRNQKIRIDAVEGDPSQGQLEYDFDFVRGNLFRVEKQAGLALSSNLKVFRGRVKIEGFQSRGLPGVVNDLGVGVTSPVGEEGVILHEVEQTGDNLLADQTQPRRGPPLPGQ